MVDQKTGWTLRQRVEQDIEKRDKGQKIVFGKWYNLELLQTYRCADSAHARLAPDESDNSTVTPALFEAWKTI